MTINGLLDSACVSSNIQIDNKIRLMVHPNIIREMNMLNGLCFQAFGRCFDIEKASKSEEKHFDRKGRVFPIVVVAKVGCVFLITFYFGIRAK